jgi:opacity protein-like surface antigen
MNIEAPNKRWGILAAVVCLVLIVPLVAENSALKVKVRVARANIRQSGAMDAPVIAVGENGQVFEVIEKSGDWYQIKLAGGGKGFIHQSVVQEVLEETPVQPKVTPPVAVTQPPKTERPPVTPPAQVAPSAIIISDDPLARKFYIRIDGGMTTKKFSYANAWQFELYYETGSVQENYETDASGFILDAGVGFFFMRNLGIEVSYLPASGTSRGTFYAAFPHPLYFGYFREAEWGNDALTFSSPELNLNLVARFAIVPKIHAYLTAGGTYFLGVKIETMKSFNYGETSYPYVDISVTPEFATYEKSGFGFNGGGGIDLFLMKNIGLNVNVRYSSGKVKIPVEDTEYTVPTGGLRASGGIKFIF